MKTVRKLLIPIAIVLILRILFQFNFFAGLEHKAQDSQFRFRGELPVSGDIVIVAVDDNTIQSLNRQWPFPREMHAKLIDNLKKAGAKQIIYDIEFTEYSNPYSDAALAVYAAEAGNVIFAGKYIVSPDNPEHQQIQMPIQPLIAEHLNWGIVNMPTDSDGYVREYTLFETMAKEKYYSLGVASLANSRLYLPDWQKGVVESNGILTVADYKIPIYQSKHALINYYGPSQTFRHIPYASVIDDSMMKMPGQFGIETDDYYNLVKNGVFKDKIVIIGATLEELHDKFPTPFNTQLTSGVEIHANFLEMVRNGNFLYELNVWIFLLLELLLAIAIFYLQSYIKPQFSLILTIIIIALILIASYLLFIKLHTLISIVELVILVLLLYVSALIVHYLKSQKDKKFIRNAFQQYMAPELVNQLLKNPKSLKYGGSQQEITVLFSDIRDFTPYSEQHKPEETVQILKEYLTAMVKTIKANSGIVDKFVGDEIMALFGTPVAYQDHALQACRTALQMREILTIMQSKWKTEGREIFEIGIGINTGFATVGNLGSEQIFDYTAIGDTVNLGARLENINKEYDTQKKIIISQFTYEKVKDRVEASFLDEVKVKGKAESVKIYELIGLK